MLVNGATGCLLGKELEFHERSAPQIHSAKQNTVKCRYNAVFGVQEIDRVIAVTAL